MTIVLIWPPWTLETDGHSFCPDSLGQLAHVVGGGTDRRFLDGTQ